MSEPRVHRTEIGRRSLTTAVWGDGRPEIVLLHDGLGSIEQWRGVPSAIADRTGRTVLAYDRAGHGSSTPVPAGPWPARWLHHEATVLSQLLSHLGAERPLLVGHSDGGSIALLHEATSGGASGVLTLAAHSWVERRCVEAIADMRRDPRRVIAGLSRHHAHPVAVFEAWSGVWTSEEFRTWDVRPQLGAVSAPVWVVQGDEDEYATDAQAVETARSIGDNAVCRLLPGLGHLIPHHDPDVVVELVCELLAASSPAPPAADARAPDA